MDGLVIGSGLCAVACITMSARTPWLTVAGVLAAAFAVLAAGSSVAALVAEEVPIVALELGLFLLGVIALADGLVDTKVDRWLVERFLVRASHPARALVVGCIVATFAVSLDGAAVLAAAVLVAAARRGLVEEVRAAVAVILVCNVASVLVLHGNPTSLVVVARTSVEPASVVAPLLLAGGGALLVVLASIRRWPFAIRVTADAAPPARPRRGGTVLLLGMPIVAAAGVAAPLLDLSTAVVVACVSLATWTGARLVDDRIGRPRLPVRIVVHISVLLMATFALRAVIDVPRIGDGGAPTQLAALVIIAALAALLNNLPASTVAVALMPQAHPVCIMLALGIGGALTPHGSVATSLVLERLSRDGANELRRAYLRRVTLPALGALGGAAVIVVLMGLTG